MLSKARLRWTLAVAGLTGGMMILVTMLLLIGNSAGLAGTDQIAMETVLRINPDYKPWRASTWEPSSNVEMLLFGLQALLGASILFYCISRLRVRVMTNTSRDSTGIK